MDIQKAKNKQQGQALLFVIVVLTVALSIGVSVSSRLLSTASRTTRSDTAARAYAAAEAGAERFLLASPSDLDKVSDGDCSVMGLDKDDETGACRIELHDGNGSDDVKVNAFVTVEKYMYNREDPDGYEFSIQPNDVREISLDGYGGSEVTVCWNSTELGADSYLYYSTYDSTGFKEKDGIISESGSHDVAEFEDSTSGCLPGADYDYSYTIDLGAARLGLRIRSLYGSSLVAVFPQQNFIFPYQGHKIISVGRLEMPGEAEVAKRVSVYRPLPYLPGIFDFAIYSEGDL